MEMRLKRGRATFPPTRISRGPRHRIIPIDSVHCPCAQLHGRSRASRTDHRLRQASTLEVWTNGSITPADSIGLAAKLKDHMNIFINFEEDRNRHVVVR
jgi:DNA-directed RNA polymerase subunit alpha